MHAVAILPKRGGKKSAAASTRTLQMKLRTVGETTSFPLMMTRSNPSGKASITVYVEGVKVKTIDFDMLPTTNTYTNVDKGFAIEFPADWQQAQDRDAERITAKSPKEGPDDMFQESIDLTGMQRIGRTTSKGYRQFVETVLWLLPDFKKIDSGKTKINKMTARWIIYTFADEDAKSRRLPKLQAMLYFIVKGDDVFMIRGTATQESFDRYRPIFKQTIRSFRLLDEK
jgi:hypothetical protein